MKIKQIVAFSMFFALTACATIVGDKQHLMPIKSSPSKAEIIIVDETGNEVYRGYTPTTVTLDKSTGKYWGKKEYVITIKKSGYEPTTIPVKASANGWYLAGNLVFGGIVGWFIIDPFNGAMYNLSPQDINATLNEGKASENSYKDGTLTVVLIEDVPDLLRSKMKKIN